MGEDLFRDLEEPEQRVCQQDARQREGQREDRARDGGGGDLALHQLVVTCAEGGTDEDARTEAHAVDEEDGQRHQRVGGADGGKGVLADEFAHDDAVYGVVGELEQVAQHKGNGEIDQQRGEWSRSSCLWS